MLHESQNKSFLAERAFLEARRQLRENEAKKQTQGEEERIHGEKDEEKNEKEKDQQEDGEMVTPACQSPTVKQGEVQ